MRVLNVVVVPCLENLPKIVRIELIKETCWEIAFHCNYFCNRGSVFKSSFQEQFSRAVFKSSFQEQFSADCPAHPQVLNEDNFALQL